MNLIVFDCDDTLWELPYEEEDSYMKLPESITDYIFNYKEDVVEIYYDKRKNDDNVFVLLTNRTENVKTELLEKLKHDKGIRFDYTLFRKDDRDKSNRLLKLLNELSISEIEFYDDKYKHRRSIKSLQNKFPNINIKTIKI